LSLNKNKNMTETNKNLDRQPLYEANGKQIFKEDIINALEKSGIEPGDVILVHSDVSVFGKLIASSRDTFFKSLVESFQECVGDYGTIVMPTFTYSFSEGKVYDKESSKSTVGILTEYFRRLPDVRRTIDPMLSVAVWGKHRDDLIDIGHNSLGQYSIFDKLHRLNGKVVLFGTRECTFVHHVECMHKVPYRFTKKFKGRIIDGEKNYEDEYYYFARRLDQNSTSYYKKLERYLMANELIKEIKLGLDAVLTISTDLLFKEIYKKLDENINFLLKEENEG